MGNWHIENKINCRGFFRAGTGGRCLATYGLNAWLNVWLNALFNALFNAKAAPCHGNAR